MAAFRSGYAAPGMAVGFAASPVPPWRTRVAAVAVPAFAPLLPVLGDGLYRGCLFGSAPSDVCFGFGPVLFGATLPLWWAAVGVGFAGGHFGVSAPRRQRRGQGTCRAPSLRQA